jgi:plastocyanin
MSTSRWGSVFALCLAGLVTASCGGAEGVGPEEQEPVPAGSQVVDVHLTSGLRFEPNEVVITPGTTVRWINDAAIFHTITPDNASQPGVWARQTTSRAGVVFSQTFSQAGQTYTYHCEPHLATGMTGAVRVR